ncbi:MAG: hypothetical protein QOD44_499 [Solirubrobacteraceae bacterium]|jgi:hypothetical protein|nr:hypothetical protein [Solirubrobacteraceae bacterium]
MTSREHARRLMLILLSSDGRPGAGDAAAERDERDGKDATADRGGEPAQPQDRGHVAVVGGLTRM